MDEIYDAGAPVETTGAAAKPAPREMQIGTVVWGLLVAAIAVGLLAIANGALFDVQLAFIVLLAAAGLVLLVGSLARARRRA